MTNRFIARELSTAGRKINAPFLFTLKASGEEFGAGIKHAVDQGWLELHESGTYVRLQRDGLSATPPEQAVFRSIHRRVASSVQPGTAKPGVATP